MSGRFQIIYADPAWQYRNKTIRGGAEHHYGTMSLEKICALQISKLAADDAALFLWVTWPCLEDAFKVITAWGFTYKNCAFDWIKTTKDNNPAMGLGHWSRGNSEPCLLATRGKPKRVSADVRQPIIDDHFTADELADHLLACQRGAHSVKPPETRDRIVKLLGDVPRIELFARQRVPGWAAWGNELPPAVAA